MSVHMSHLSSLKSNLVTFNTVLTLADNCECRVRVILPFLLSHCFDFFARIFTFSQDYEFYITILTFFPEFRLFFF